MIDGELIVRSRRDERTYKALPQHALEGDFPSAFVRHYVHWLHLESGYVEWRPWTDCWRPAPEENWVMRTGAGCRSASLIRGPLRLIDIRSDTAVAVAAVLRPLEILTHLHLTWNDGDRRLHVHLPRLSLDFIMENGTPHLTSKQFRGMHVDDDSAIGTLTGLSSKLVLRHINGSSRSIIVPHGEVRVQARPGHVHVSIEPGHTAERVAFESYRIDDCIGRLVGNGGVTNALFRCYLHAVTASCFEDALLGRTGTEEALAILDSASVSSSLRRTPRELELLGHLAALTPRRVYYPRHLQEMQTVSWVPDLSPLSQHPGFARSVCVIKERVAYTDVFCGVEMWGDLDRGPPALLSRAAERDSALRVDGLFAGSPSPEHDVAYVARDNLSGGEREHDVYDVARLVDTWTEALGGGGKILSTMQLENATVSGGDLPHGSLNMGYDPRWLKRPDSYLPSHWAAMQMALSRSDPGRDKYTIMVFMCTVAFSRESERYLAPMLLAFATVPELRELRMPRHDNFPLAQGSRPLEQTIRDVLDAHARPFTACPEANLPRMLYESDAEAADRRWRAYEVASSSARDLFVERLKGQFPVERLKMPLMDDCASYFNVELATDALKPTFNVWFRNHQFHRYVDKAQDILDRLPPRTSQPRPGASVETGYSCRPQRCRVTFADLFSQTAPALEAMHPEMPSDWLTPVPGEPRD